jgi:hypothetical protein
VTERTLDEEVVLLRGEVEALKRWVADVEGLDIHPVDWSSLDREEAEEEWAQLTEFVDWLTDRYGIGETVPPCWFAHPPMLEELSALRAAWLGVYLNPTASADAGVGWHDNLEKVLLRIREWDRCACGGGTHRDDLPVPGDPDSTDARDRYIAADMESRLDPPAPDGPPPSDAPTAQSPPRCACSSTKA